MHKKKGKLSISAKRPKPPRKPKNKDQRTREYLTQSEIEKLRKAARKHTRHGHRNDTLILLMFRHAFRVSEIVALRWDQIDLKKGLLHVNRIKNGLSSTHPLRGVELRALRPLQREYDNNTTYVFMSQKGAPLATRTNI